MAEATKVRGKVITPQEIIPEVREPDTVTLTMSQEQANQLRCLTNQLSGNGVTPREGHSLRWLYSAICGVTPMFGGDEFRGSQLKDFGLQVYQ